MYYVKVAMLACNESPFHLILRKAYEIDGYMNLETNFNSGKWHFQDTKTFQSHKIMDWEIFIHFPAPRLDSTWNIAEKLKCVIF